MEWRLWSWSRTRQIVNLWLVLFAVCIAGVLLAADGLVIPPVQGEPSVLLVGFQKALASGQWGLAVGLALTLLVAILGRTASVWKDVDVVKPWLPHITLVAAVAAAIGGGLIAGGGVVTIAVALLGAVQLWLTAVGGWETIGKGIKWCLSKLRKDGKVEKEAQVKTLIKAAIKTNSLDLSKIRGMGLKVYDGGVPQ